MANGAVMLAVPDTWYVTVPGVTETGPANIHFIRDIGLAFLAAGVALVMTARRGAGTALLLPSAVFLGGHALLHLSEMPLRSIATFASFRDLVFIVLPGLFPIYVLWRWHERSLERSA